MDTFFLGPINILLYDNLRKAKQLEHYGSLDLFKMSVFTVACDLRQQTR